MANRILRMPDVEQRVGLKRSQIQNLERDGLFPSKIKITENGRASGYVESEVDEWIAARVKAARRKTLPVAEPAPAA